MLREEFEALRLDPTVSVLIIGGGINGIGVFRELALQDVDVLLVDRGDFGSGASAASSHMLHGGIRYLENGEFRLVREALTERNLLLHNAPHYARPLPTTIPIFSRFSGLLNAPLKFLGLRDKPSERGALVIKLGLMLYDIFASSYRVMPTHTMMGRQQSLARYPAMHSDVQYTATYYDAWMPYPERLCLELVLDTLAAAGGHATALNYVSAVRGDPESVTLRDELTGETVAVRPRLVINAAGPWIDFVNEGLNAGTQFIGGTKGSHLILDHPELLAQIGDHEIFFENNDGRIVLILPFMGRVMVGTTDIRIDNPDDAVTTDAERDYMLGMIRRVFPTIPVERSHIVFHFSGVRPLPSSDKNFTGNVSRDHSIRVLEPNAQRTFPIYALVGGKWTTWRAFAEQTANKVLAHLNKPRKTSTEHVAIGGGKHYPRTESEQSAWIKRVHQASGLPMHRVRDLFQRYGTRAEAIASFMRDDLDTPLKTLPDYSRREIHFLAHSEHIVHLDDLLLRRSLIGWLGGVTEPLLAELADALAEALGWSMERRAQEIARTLEILAAQHGVIPAADTQRA